ncbi:MAG: LamG domain-containing protein [Myxococcota bacterium]|nr:LamG domain-containing protein [Myxococcota bacterium]
MPRIQRAAWAGAVGVAACASVALVLPSCAVRASSDCTARAICADPSSGAADKAAPPSDGASMGPDTTADASGDEVLGDPTGADSSKLPDDAADGGFEDARNVDAFGEVGQEAASLDAATSDGPDAGGDTGAASGGGDAATPDGAADGGIATGLVAYYRFDETSGNNALDSSGNSRTASMRGATFGPGLHGNAATMDGVSEYVSLPDSIVAGLTSFSISAWVYQNTSLNHARLFDLGTGPTTYMFFTPATSPARFAITTAGQTGEDRIDVPTLAVGSWQHTVVTFTGGTGTLYVNGVKTSQNTTITLNPSNLGATNQNWLGRSQYAADPYLNGRIDNFRIYDRALSQSDVLQLFQQQL